MKIIGKLLEGYVGLIANPNEQAIKTYVKNQGKKYNQIYRGQLTFFEDLP